MSAQPEALRIADECEQSAAEWRNEVDTRMQAAAELRRLHAENKTLKKKLQRGREVWIASAESWSRDVAEKDALLRQAVDAWDSDEIDTDPVAEVIDAIRNYLTPKGATQ